MDASFYQDIVELSPVAFAYHKIVLDEAGSPCDCIFLQVNKAFEVMTGLRREDILGKRASQVISSLGNVRIDYIATFGEIAQCGGAVEFENYAAKENRWYRVQAFSPEQHYFAVQFLDVSKEKQQEQEHDRLLKELQDNAQTFHYIIRNLPFSLDIIALDGTILFMNEVGRQLFEIEEDLSDSPNAEFFWAHPEERLRFVWAIEHDGVVKSWEFEFQTRTGRRFWALISGMRIDYQGQVCTLTAVHDISDRKAMESALKESREKYRLIFEYAAESILVVQNSRIQISNSVTQKMTGYSEEELSQMLVFDLFHPEDRPRAVTTYHDRFSGTNMIQKPHYRMLRKDREITWIEVNGVRTSWNGRPALQYFMVDITEQKKTEMALKASEEKYRLIAEFASDMIWVYNYTQRKFTYLSPSITNFLGYTPEEALAVGMTGIVSETFISQAQAMMAVHVQEFLKDPDAGQTYISEIQNYHKNGRPIWVELSSRYRFGTNGDIEIVGLTRNIEERKHSEEEVLYLSYHDQLTGLYNRRFYEEELKRLDTGRNLPLSLILADVNGLKLTNDAFGHLAGDQLLIRTAGILKRECRSDDIIARIGGDEFIFLLPQTGHAAAQDMILRMKKALSEESDGKTVLSVAFGTSTKVAPEQTSESVFLDAENSMYRQKLSESNSVRSEAIKKIMQTFFGKNRDEEAHNKRVGQLCGKIARAMGMRDEAVEEMISAGEIHDIGKISMSQELLGKAEPLTTQERAEYQRHPETGYQILKASAEFAQIAQYILSHHEWVDGSGYPRGITGDQIPLQSRILSVADCFDILTHPRQGQNGMDQKSALEEIKSRAGTQFDENVVRALEGKVLDQLAYGD